MLAQIHYEESRLRAKLFIIDPDSLRYKFYYDPF